MSGKSHKCKNVTLSKNTPKLSVENKPSSNALLFFWDEYFSICVNAVPLALARNPSFFPAVGKPPVPLLLCHPVWPSHTRAQELQCCVELGLADSCTRGAAAAPLSPGSHPSEGDVLVPPVSSTTLRVL